ncbi:MAG: ABC transporter permease [Angelakisella sp.]
MSTYLIKRIFSALVTIFLVATLTFFLMNMVPGGPFLAEKSPSPETIALLNEKYGLDKPVPEQYVNYMTHLAQGDFGTSLKKRGKEVNDIIATGFPVSAKLGGIAAIIAMCIGVPLGAVAALNRGNALDNSIIVVATCGISVPSFVVTSVMMIFLGVTYTILPTMGLSGPLSYIMPVTALAFYPTAYISRLMRSSMLDVLGQDYMRTARAKGLSQTKMLFKHALRNAILPVVTYIGPMIAYVMTGSFVVEKILTIPGLGNEFISSITDRDYPLIMGMTIFLAALVIFMNVVVDIVYKLVDPRIKLK